MGTWCVEGGVFLTLMMDLQVGHARDDGVGELRMQLGKIGWCVAESLSWSIVLQVCPLVLGLCMVVT